MTIELPKTSADAIEATMRLQSRFLAVAEELGLPDDIRKAGFDALEQNGRMQAEILRSRQWAC